MAETSFDTLGQLIVPTEGSYMLWLGSIDYELTVDYWAYGTATSGVDYEVLSEQVTFAEGSATAIVNVNPIDDSLG